MSRHIGWVVTVALVLGIGGQSRGAGPTEILDKAIKALGGEEKLAKAQKATWKTKGVITFMGSDNEFTTTSSVNGLSQFRQEFEGDFGGNKIMGVTVVNGDKGWRVFMDNKTELDKDSLANEKRNYSLSVIPMTLLDLKGKDFKVENGGEEKVGDKAQVGLKVTGADGKDFRLFFDKESGLPVRLVAKVSGFDGAEFTQETTLSDYKEVGGIQKAMKVKSTRDGEKFIEQQITEFKVLDKVDAKTFGEP